MAKKRKPSSRGSKRRPTGRRPAELPLQQGLVELATMGARSLLWVVFTTAILAAIAGLAFTAWTLRPVPAYGSEGVEIGSPFDATFRVENANQWFPLARLSISCVLMYAGEPNIPPIAASNSPSHLEPGEAATFKCPFRTALRGGSKLDLDTALRSEIYFHSTYDLPLIGSFRLTDHRGPFVLNTRLLPPRWTGKP
jgi:hypothetical protein